MQVSTSRIARQAVILLVVMLQSGCQLIPALRVAAALSTGGGGDPYLTKSAAGRSSVSYSSAAAGDGGANNGNGQQSAGMGKFLSDGISRGDKLRAFLECRKECIAKCDRLVYVYSTKKEFCHDCIRQCMVAVLQQAKSLGIEFSFQEERMQGDSPRDSSLPSSDGDRQRLRRNRNRNRNQKERQMRRERRQRKEQEKQKLLKNCIVH